MKKFITLICLLLTCVIFAAAQKSPRLPAKNKPATTAATAKLPIIFAVLNDGKTLEPIALIENGKLLEKSDGAADSNKEFVKNYYKPQTAYKLIFGGVNAGKVAVMKGNAETECAANLADVTTVSATAKLKGMVMALATNAESLEKSKGLRRLPTAAERSEIEKLVRAEFGKQKVSATLLKILHSHNLTALDIDNDGKPELVGSYWVANKPKERSLLFFIAERDTTGKYVFSYQEFENFTADKVMSGEIQALDTGIYNNLLLDVFDIDGDGTSEIFTITQAFEGNNFFAYKREAGKWTKVLETYNYHCAY